MASNQTQYYIYLGDRMTDPILKGSKCRAVLRPDGKCIRGKNGNMLVEFEIPVIHPHLLYKVIRAVVVGRRLRKQRPTYSF